ncbi:hypothetical protein EDD86DRAFT_245071 [Gorgonomyces haynaldii]|nr:hypothetical protein EDD86DRAFT_245071 [Gorgonomyces haynaldii]
MPGVAVAVGAGLLIVFAGYTVAMVLSVIIVAAVVVMAILMVPALNLYLEMRSIAERGFEGSGWTLVEASDKPWFARKDTRSKMIVRTDFAWENAQQLRHTI